MMQKRMSRNGTRFVSLCAPAVLALLLSAPSGASAAEPSAAWTIGSVAYPSDFSTRDNARCEAGLGGAEPGLGGSAFGECDAYAVTATNIGAAGTEFIPKSPPTPTVTLTDTLPAGVTARNVSLFLEAEGREGTNLAPEFCTLTPVRCDVPLTSAGLHQAIKPDQALKMYVSVTVDEPATSGSLTNTASVAGGIAGGTHEVSTSQVNTLETGTSPFGAALFSSPFVGLDGQPDAQAGGHPYEFATRIGPATNVREDPEGFLQATSVEDIRDVIVDLPVGMAGSGTSAAQCTLARLASRGEAAKQGVSGCPADTIIGHIRTYPVSNVSANSPIYNLVPDRGFAAELGFLDGVQSTHVLYVSLAPTPSGYVLRTTSKEVPQITLNEIVASVFGDPSARDGASEASSATFTNPSDCTGEPLTTTVLLDSWQHPGSYNADGSPDLSDPRWASSTFESPAVTGCEALAGLFNPTIEAKPESSQADTPTGLDVNLKVPQQQGAETLGTPPVKDTVVTLPEGLTVNPSSANGLGACSEAQAGISPAGVPDAAAPECPDASKIGNVELETPTLAMEACKQSNVPLQECPAESEREKTPLHGSIYVARQLENPFGSLLALYIVVDDPRTGVIVKIPAEIKANETTGQLTTIVPNTPQFPFSELRTHFFGGDTASLRTPATCGSYTVNTELTPWSAPESGPPATPASQFEVASGAGGGACAASAAEEPNAPSFGAGTTAPTAGAYSPLVVHMTRADGSQNFSRVNVTLPPGATGKLAGIPQCSDAQIATAQARSNPGQGATELASPSCPASSQIGTVAVGAGAGPSPFYVTGKAYLAGPYKGAPFSMAIVTPAVAGPFDLGVVVVRAGLYINPVTAQVTAKSDAIPTILQGIPLDVRSVVVNVDRPGFTLNPTSCAPMTVTGEETSTQGQVAQLSNHFQVGSCQNLAFKPDLTASTAGKASKANGAALDVRVAYPSAPFTGYANIRSVKVSLPKQLPSRLTTLQKACLASVFEANPASCPTASDVGTATASTPLLSSPLTGPAYIVSHGGEAFPDLEVVLQGENITLILDGNTQIKNGITSSTFKSVPDAPVSSFELKLPTGRFSILGANVPQSAKYSLCGQTLTMPTEITAQNGALINKTTKIAITGCAKVKTITRAEKLKKALKACHQDKKRAKRAKCEKAAHKRYGPVKSKQKAKRKHKAQKQH
jgi:hypothetical protein